MLPPRSTLPFTALAMLSAVMSMPTSPQKEMKRDAGRGRDRGRDRDRGRSRKPRPLKRGRGRRDFWATSDGRTFFHLAAQLSLRHRRPGDDVVLSDDVDLVHPLS